jgi:tRNA threonylcarbamoyladenosine modification (KEOPS) complex  Pcc1 subunit
MSNDIKDQLYTKVTLVISIDDRKRAESILKALIPDNVNIPQSLEMEFKLSNNNDSANIVLEFKARCNDDKSIRTLASTIDEVLEHIDVMNKVLNSKGA